MTNLPTLPREDRRSPALPDAEPRLGCARSYATVPELPLSVVCERLAMARACREAKASVVR